MSVQTVFVVITTSTGQVKQIRQKVQSGREAAVVPVQKGDKISVTLEGVQDAQSGSMARPKPVLKRQGKSLLITDADGRVLVDFVDHFAADQVQISVEPGNFSIGGLQAEGVLSDVAGVSGPLLRLFTAAGWRHRICLRKH